MSIPTFEEIIEPNDQTEARAEHLEKLLELTGNVYPNKFVRTKLTGSDDTISAIKSYQPIADVEARMAAVRAGLKEGERPPAEIKDAINAELKALGNVRIAGRLTTPPRGNFVHLTDGMSKLQIYAKKGQFTLIKNDGKDTPDEENAWTAWQMIDHGDFVGVDGYLFVTNTGEVSVHVEKLQFLAKAMLPMPDKMHGIEDPEIKQRQRYVDLIGSSLQVKAEPPASAGGTNAAGKVSGDDESVSISTSLPPADAGGSALTTREVFERRAKIISSMRRFLEDHGYVEVETPMLTPKATGAAAKPFETHHNALDIKLYARIAPELYLKRLVVGGFEKVYELNRNFRNEGISYKHNPEFTMLEFYCAYMDVNGMMDFCEELLRQSVEKATGGLVAEYEGNQIDFGRFERITMSEAVVRVSEPGAIATGSLPASKKNPVATAPGSDLLDRELLERFESDVEQTLIQPTFIIDFPKSISPLSKADPMNPQIAERFELFINGMEVANGFSELNDPKEQYERFVDQMSERERGDEEAMVLDEDYIRALSYGMPPAAGIGIGIDRLTMLLTNKHSIRDVILFPHTRPEKKDGEARSGGEGESESGD
ncbi:MAG: lysine--tRNA ligase [Acidobacteria bacterium]|nr:lysine--tRNA ligase [Acidobacteriota bacterium]